eukprot:TRINITY_DN984_c0_g1_i5.p1 TRINITY_DN984_c0_g1~~TRINITY_DN984_c0_g1_i5.p1  ORF type:complete len:888 (-),score=228.03 TRINITY_DN984_c0_g1_i5:70-2733(-)
MSFLSSAFNSIRTFYGEINSATLTGAIDVVVVEQQDGSYHSSPFHVRFGKLGVLKAKEKIVNIEINGESVDIHMKLDDAGTAFFVEEITEEECPEYLATSPIPEAEPLLCVCESQGPEKPKAEEKPPNAVVLPLAPTKPKKKRKSRPKHSRSGSKTSLREINPDIFEMDDVEGDGDVDESDEDKAASSTLNPDKELEDLAKATSSSRGSITSINLAEIDNSFLGSRILRSISEKENFEANLPTKKSKGDVPNKAPSRSGGVRKESSSIKADLHYFSEPDEVEKQASAKTPKRSRSPGGILSDTEYETTKLKPEDDMTTSWRWGELPSTSTSTPVTSPAEGKPFKKKQKASEEVKEESSKDSDPKKWSIFNYLRASRKDGNAANEGVYLDDINDEEMLALYVGRASRKYEDAESGNGPSLPMSPHPAEGRTHEDLGPQLYMSLCGYSEDTFSPALFEQSIISFDDVMLKLQNNSDIFSDPNLIVKIDDNYFSGKDSIPALMCRAFFKRPLPNDFLPKPLLIPRVETEPLIREVVTEEPPMKPVEEVENEVETLKKTEEEQPEEEANSIKANTEEEPSSMSIPKDEDPEIKEEKEESNDDPPSYETLQCEENKVPETSQPEESRQKKSWWPWSNREPKTAQNSSESVKTLETLEEVSEKLSSEVKKRSINSISGNSSDSSNASWNEKVGTTVPSSHGAFIRGKERFKKTLRLSSDEVKRLNLRDGSNEAEFTVTTPYQGTSYCKCHIYLWKYTDKIVISDIDGTITKSDVLGHIFPIIGRDWAQSGVAQLFNKIRHNGYHLIYLSARAIGQASITKEYLQSIKQGDLCLPDGPLLLNPTSLISAFHREVIEKKPEEFKISCLRDIQRLFDINKNPFYAGYGNRSNVSEC